MRLPPIHCVVRGSVTAPVLRFRRQPGPGRDRPVRAQQQISRLEQLITAGSQACAGIQPELRQPSEGLDGGGVILQMDGQTGVVPSAVIAWAKAASYPGHLGLSRSW